MAAVPRAQKQTRGTAAVTDDGQALSSTWPTT
jgi:hypothetical protein